MPATRRGGVHWPHHDHVRRGAPTRLHASAYPAALAGGPRSPAAGDLAGARRPRQRAVREVAAPPAGNAVLVAGRVAEPAGPPALSRPHRPDGAVHLVRPSGRGPVHRAAGEVVEPADPVRGAQLVGERVADRTALPTNGRPLGPDGAVHLVRPSGRGPVHRPAVEVLPGTAGGAVYWTPA